MSLKKRYQKQCQRFKTWQAERRLPWNQAKWFAVDIETTGLDAEQDQLLSLAWVPIEPPFVSLGQAGYELVSYAASLKQSSTIHQLTPEVLAQGKNQAEVLQQFVQATQGAYLVAHYAPLEQAFLREAMQKEQLDWNPLGWYDTLFAAKQKKALTSGRIEHLYSLAQLRAEYGLLPFQAHHARSDAIACAELFLAQVYQRMGQQTPSVRRVLRWGGALFK